MGRPKNWATAETQRLEAAMVVQPPVIQWRRKPNGILVHTSVFDPYVDLTHHKNEGKQACNRGHAFDDENTIRRPDGSRDCRTCKRARDRASEARKRAAA